MAPAHNQAFGRFGEDAAASWYTKAGYSILERNWRCAEGEIDVIASSAETVAFIEVKSRSTNRFGSGAEAVGYRKQQRIRTVALQWLRQQDHSFGELRFDVVAVDRRGRIEAHLGCF